MPSRWTFAAGILPSLTRRKPRFALQASLGFLRRSIGMGSPSLRSLQCVAARCQPVPVGDAGWGWGYDPTAGFVDRRFGPGGLRSARTAATRRSGSAAVESCTGMTTVF